ncbi:MAG: hypothetical protein AAF234_05210 [Pseudomonadota bacterium]
MDSIKDLFEAFAQRIRSPVIGYILLMAVLFNWKAFFFLFFSGDPAIDKFAFFDDNTNGWSLLGLPLIAGILAALLTPWVNWAGQVAVQKPMMMQRTRNAQAAHEIALLRAKHKNAENSMVDELIQAAKQDETVLQIEDPEVRTKLEEQISDLRESQKRFFSSESGNNKLELSGNARDIPGSDIGKQMEVLVTLAKNLEERGDYNRANEVIEEVLKLSKQISSGQ